MSETLNENDIETLRKGAMRAGLLVAAFTPVPRSSASIGITGPISAGSGGGVWNGTPDRDSVDP